MAVVAVAGVGGVARAYWAAAGTGTGSATAATTSELIVEPATAADVIYPGTTSDVVVSVANPNRSSAHIGSVRLDVGQAAGGFAVDAAHSGCDLSALSFADQTNAGAGWTVPAGDGTTSGSVQLTLPGALAMSVDAANACQGAMFTIYLAAGP